MGTIVKNGIDYSGTASSAENVRYDGTMNVKEAIDEVKSDLDETNSNLSAKANNFVYNVASGETLAIPYGELPAAYICATKGSDGSGQSVIVGTGYGATTIRHKISELIGSTYVVYAVDETMYGLTITNNTATAISVGITAII